MPSTYKVTISLPHDLHEHAKARQKELGYTRSMYVQQLIRADKRNREKKAAAEAKTKSG